MHLSLARPIPGTLGVGVQPELPSAVHADLRPGGPYYSSPTHPELRALTEGRNAGTEKRNSQVPSLPSHTLPSDAALLSLPTGPHSTRRGSSEARDCSGAPPRASLGIPGEPSGQGSRVRSSIGTVLLLRLQSRGNQRRALGSLAERVADREAKQAGQGIADRTDERGRRLAFCLAGGGASQPAPRQARVARQPLPRLAPARALSVCPEEDSPAPGSLTAWGGSRRVAEGGRERSRAAAPPLLLPPPRRAQGAAGGSAAAASGPSSSSSFSSSSISSLPPSAVVMARRWSTKESPRWRSALVLLFLAGVYGKCPRLRAPLTEQSWGDPGPRGLQDRGFPGEPGRDPGCRRDKDPEGLGAAEGVDPRGEAFLFVPTSRPSGCWRGAWVSGRGESRWSGGMVAGGLPDLGWRAPCSTHPHSGV